MKLRSLRRHGWAIALGTFVPVSWVVDVVIGPGVEVFLIASVGIIPLAWFMGIATEELGKHAGPGVGGLLNATFGNATELIIALFALARGLDAVVKASLTGSIIGNILLVLGLSMLAGGLKNKRQVFSREASGIQTSMLLLAVIGFVMPDLLDLAIVIPDRDQKDALLRDMSVGIGVILFVAYLLGLVFSLWTHRDVFNPVGEKHEPPVWSLRLAVVVLLVATALVALESEILVGSIETARGELGLTELFVGVIIVAIVGNAAEHSSAVLVAYRNKMDLSVAIATTSTVQIALFVGPVLVFSSLVLGPTLTLNFEIFELVSIALATAVLGAVVADGQSNWYEGVLLLMVYAIIGVSFFLHPPPPVG
jgi:Ca2+:H+ antiporter